MKATYQLAYRELFSLLIHSGKAWDSEEVKQVRREMDELAPRGKLGDQLKLEWGLEVGQELYAKEAEEKYPQRPSAPGASDIEGTPEGNRADDGRESGGPPEAYRADSIPA